MAKQNPYAAGTAKLQRKRTRSILWTTFRMLLATWYIGAYRAIILVFLALANYASIAFALVRGWGVSTFLLPIMLWCFALALYALGEWLELQQGKLQAKATQEILGVIQESGGAGNAN